LKKRRWYEATGKLNMFNGHYWKSGHDAQIIDGENENLFMEEML